jgi:hypothetical protein
MRKSVALGIESPVLIVIVTPNLTVQLSCRRPFDTPFRKDSGCREN